MDDSTLKTAQETANRWRDLKNQLHQAKTERDAAIQAAENHGHDQTAIVKATGLTRETIRRITNPDAAEAARKAAADRRGQRRGEPGQHP